MMRRVIVLCAVLLAGCKPSDERVTLRFQPVADGAPLTCTASPGGKALTDLRFFIYDVELITADGNEQPVAMDTTPPWQNGAVALVDLEDGQGACDTGSPATHAAVTGHVAPGEYVGMRFTLGVPFSLNHADPATAVPPLDRTEMHWHWLAGYKFLRAGMRKGDDLAWLHLGSTGCEGRIGAVSSCAQPNRTTIKLAAFDLDHDVVAVDLGTLFAEAMAADGTHACQSEPDNVLCAPMLRHLGLGDAPQDVFRAMAK